MTYFLALVLVALIGPAAHAGVRPDAHSPLPTCENGALAQGVDALIKPALLASATAARSGTEWDEAFEDAFYKLLAMKGAIALEAKVALMSYYIGEHYGEELVEEVLKDPEQADALVSRYRACRPRVSFEDQLDGFLVLRALYDIYEGIRARSNAPAAEPPAEPDPRRSDAEDGDYGRY